MSAQPDTDRSLTADKPTTEPEVKTGATTEAIPHVRQPVYTPTPDADADTKTGAGDTNASPDISSLNREQLEARVKTLAENLASANTEAEFFRQQWQDLRLRDEALGVEALTIDQTKLEDKVVQSVKELYQSEMKRREALVLLDKLLSTTGQMIQTAPKYDPKVRADYEVASRAAKDYLAGHSGAEIPIGTTLSDGKVSDMNPDLNAVILNLGKTQGVKEGMSFQIYQDNLPVATVKVVLAREMVSAALVLSAKPGTMLKVGDRAAVDANP